MQIQLMKQFCGCARYVYNRTLSLERSLYKKDNKHTFKYAEAANRLPEWKKKNPFLKQCHSQVLQQSLKDLDQAYTNDNVPVPFQQSSFGWARLFNKFQIIVTVNI